MTHHSLRRLLVLAPCALAACSQLGIGKPLAPASAQVALAQGGLGFDALFVQAQTAYLAIAPKLPAATKATLKADFAKLASCPAGATSEAQCTGLVVLADRAVAAADQATLTQEIAAILPVLTEIQSITNPGAPAPTAAVLLAPATPATH